MRTNVYLTVDVECAEERIVRGQFQAPVGYDLRMWGRFDNQPEELGLPLLMRELERHGFRGTFFVEPLGSPYFGAAGLAEVCGALRGRGHDVQLHTHPIQRRPTYRSDGVPPEPDDIGAYTTEAQVQLLDEGLRLLEGAGVPRSELTVFRAGNFGAANETWEAMARVGLTLSSNYNPCYFGKNCKMRTPLAKPGLFRTPVGGIWELPITCFEEHLPWRPPRYRHLQIAAVTAAETIECLRQCHALGISEVTLVTHSFELYFIDSVAKRQGRVNHTNLSRLQSVLAFLRDYPDDFTVETARDLAQRLSAAPASAAANDGANPAAQTGDSPGAASHAFPQGRPALRLRRLLSQVAKRAAARWPLSLPATPR